MLVIWQIVANSISAETKQRAREYCLILPSCLSDAKEHQTKHFKEKSGYGVDLSHHNTVTNWELVEADFIFLKAEGSTFKDPKYTSYRNEAQKRGIAGGGASAVYA